MKPLSRDKSLIVATILFEGYDKYDPFETLDVKLEATISVYEDLREGRADEVMAGILEYISNADEDEDVSDLVDVLEYLEEETA